MNRAILRIAAWLVNGSDRRVWLTEWTSELWYVTRHHSRRYALAFCLGAFKDAIWLRRNRSNPLGTGWLRSPSRCLLFLGFLAAASTLFACRLAWLAHPQPILAHLLILFIALLILPATTSLSMGEYPVDACSSARALKYRRWMFFGIKVALILPISFLGTFDLAPIIGVGLQPHATLVGYVLGLRWALADQRRRCPVCLRVLGNPIRIGEPSQTFLEWYGTEFVCGNGHGLLHVPEIQMSYTVQRWLPLDASWSGLFRSH